MYHNISHNSAKGKLGVSLLPGAVRVWDRSEDTLKSCTLDLCPWSVPIPSVTSIGSLTTEGIVPPSVSASRILVNQPGFSAFPLDRLGYDTTFSSPQQAGGGVMMVKGYRFQMETFLQMRTASTTQASRMYSNSMNLTNVLQNLTYFDLSYWTSNGYNALDTLEYLRAVSSASSVVNAAGDIVLPSSPAYR